MNKDQLHKFGINIDCKCIYCAGYEAASTCFFYCRCTRIIWAQVLHWIKIEHSPQSWELELDWLCKTVSRKNSQSKVLQIAIAEVI